MKNKKRLREEEGWRTLLFIFLFLEDVIELHLVISGSLHLFQK
jgi:hypothetical protein